MRIASFSFFFSQFLLLYNKSETSMLGDKLNDTGHELQNLNPFINMSILDRPI